MAANKLSSEQDELLRMFTEFVLEEDISISTFIDKYKNRLVDSEICISAMMLFVSRLAGITYPRCTKEISRLARDIVLEKNKPKFDLVDALALSENPARKKKPKNKNVVLDKPTDDEYSTESNTDNLEKEMI